MEPTHQKLELMVEAPRYVLYSNKGDDSSIVDGGFRVVLMSGDRAAASSVGIVSTCFAVNTCSDFQHV